MNPDEYAPVSIPLQVGQEWRTYGGETIILTDYDSEDKTFRATNKARACIRHYKYDGSCNTIWKSDFLKELITPAPAFEEGQVWLRANGAKVHLKQNFSTLKAYFANEEDNDYDYTGFFAKIEFLKPDEDYNLVKLLKQAPVKPPLGLRPRFIALEERIREINEAIDRYREAEIAIPSEWLDEKNFILYDLDRLAFNRWWDSEGSAMAPKENENQQEYVRRVSHVAWDNGIFMGRHHETT
jgi:hypothetical protein